MKKHKYVFASPPKRCIPMKELETPLFSEKVLAEAQPGHERRKHSSNANRKVYWRLCKQGDTDVHERGYKCQHRHQKPHKEPGNFNCSFPCLHLANCSSKKRSWRFLFCFKAQLPLTKVAVKQQGRRQESKFHQKKVVNMFERFVNMWHCASTSRSMFFNLFAAAEPSANVCVARGTLCNDPSVYPTFSLMNQAISVCFGSKVLRNPGWNPLF